MFVCVCMCKGGKPQAVVSECVHMVQHRNQNRANLWIQKIRKFQASGHFSRNYWSFTVNINST